MTTSTASAEVQELPRGVVTFLFTDIQGSTQLLHRLGDAYADVLGTHRRLLRETFAAHDGHEVDTQGDSFFVAFASARQAVAAAADGQRALQTYPWEHGEPVLVRMGLHTGEPLLVDGHYVGMDVHRAARIANAGHGGQVLVSARTLELAGTTPAKDLGDHRLKDLDRPERIYQLTIDGLADTFPPLKSLGSPTNVPHHLSSLIGRTRERRQLLELLSEPAVHLVTVTGTGGTGKTRLGAAVALDAREHFPDGVWFVDLTTTSSAELVAPAVARVLEIEVDGGPSTEQRLIQHLSNRAMLLMIDNFEQVIAGAIPVSRILEACPHLKVLATSRIPLGIHGEQEYPLDTLSLPRGDSFAEIEASEAVQMFASKASQVRPSFELTSDNAPAVAQVCRLLDGLPLAIELAASRIKLFSPRVLVRRLDDRLGLLSGGAADSPIRHRALRTTIDWSYDLLSPGQREFFTNMSVFSGGATFEAIEAVATTGDGDVMDCVSTLVNHSLLRQREDADGETRFYLLQVLADYSREVLAQHPERLRALHERHAQHFLALAERVRGVFQGVAPDEALLDQEQDNLRAALEFWLDDAEAGHAGSGDKALSLTAAMAYHWYYHGLARDGSRWIERALAAATDPTPQSVATATRMLGVLTEVKGDSERAVDLLERAVELHRAAGMRSGEAACLNSLGATYRSMRRHKEAEQTLSQAIAIRQETEDARGLLNVRNNLALVYLDQGEVERARVIFEENLASDRERNDDWGAAASMLNLGVTRLLGDAEEEARGLVAAALTTFLEVEDADGIAEGLEACVGLAAAQGKWLAGLRLAGAADAYRQHQDLQVGAADRVHVDGWTTECRAHADSAQLDSAEAEGARMTLDQATSYARSEVLAPVAP